MEAVTPTPNDNSTTLPLLDAISSAALTQQNTNEWAKNISAFSSSPNNLISLGESPPGRPASYEDRPTNFGWTSIEQRGIPSGHPASASPPASHRRRPVSYHLDGNLPHNTNDHSQAPYYHARRSSMYSQFAGSRYGPHPPLPHQAQAHFYGLPDANNLLSPGLTPGENGYYCGFDSLSTTLQNASKPMDVIITGYDGGLDIHAVTRRGLNKVAKIVGLRGGVYHAKIIPWVVGEGTSGQLPLIAVVVHGPVDSSTDTAGEYANPSPENPTIALNYNSRERPRTPSQAFQDKDGPWTEYQQTTVEVYSLRTNRHIATLLTVPKTRLTTPTFSPLFRAPLSVGSLTIHADNGNIVIASGTTGETWVFHQSVASDTSETFRCIGKVWTSIQQGLTIDSSHSPNPKGISDGDWQTADHSSAQQSKASILSLNGRWLAYCPSAPSSQICLRAVIPGTSSMNRIPGLSGQTPPQLPAVNCLVETPGGESMMKQLAQAATQEMIKGATYLGKQGVQAWNSYWNKSPSNQTTNPALPYQNHVNTAHQFPPTHGVANQTPPASRDPGLISIIDLDFLARQNSVTGASPHPLATFKVPHGCSFLSFAPNGLALFTASSKGDVQAVWDLMRIQYAKPSFLKTGSQGVAVQGPHVRQVAQFSRMTIARIVDVVWTSPYGQRAAMVTERGTVHILDLPASAFVWPPPRRKLPATKMDDDLGSTSLSASNVASNAVNSLWTVAKPLVSGRRRRSSTSITAISAASMTSQAGHGTQALAAGISRSVGAATGRVNEMRKSGGSKLHLPRSSVTPTRSCIRLLNGKHNDSAIVVGDGLVGYYTIRGRKTGRSSENPKVSRSTKYVEFRLPSLPEPKDPSDLVLESHQVGDLEITEGFIDDHRLKVRMPQTRPRGAESSIPQAEIESNTPYQPFHTDRRVSLHVYTHEEADTQSPSVSVLLSPLRLSDKSASEHVAASSNPWAFGGAIKTIKLDVGPPDNSEDLYYTLSEHRALPTSAIERVMKFTEKSEDTEQIVVTTRIRKNARFSGDAGDFEEGFFEDDCEVLDFASQRV
jgi:hypothetical protein